MTFSQHGDLICWAIQWRRAAGRSGLPFDVLFAYPGADRFVAQIRYRGKSTDLTLHEPVTRAELDGMLNTIGWGLRHAAGEITTAELRAALGLPAGLVGVVPVLTEGD